MPHFIAHAIVQSIKKDRTAHGSVSWDRMHELVLIELKAAGIKTTGDEPDEPKAPKKPANATPSPFGDPKAIPPTPAQVDAYALNIGTTVQGGPFCDFYESKGWLVGKAKMKNWQAAVRTWARDPQRQPAAPTQNSKYDLT